MVAEYLAGIRLEIFYAPLLTYTNSNTNTCAILFLCVKECFVFSLSHEYDATQSKSVGGIVSTLPFPYTSSHKYVDLRLGLGQQFVENQTHFS